MRQFWTLCCLLPAATANGAIDHLTEQLDLPVVTENEAAQLVTDGHCTLTSGKIDAAKGYRADRKLAIKVNAHLKFQKATHVAIVDYGNERRGDFGETTAAVKYYPLICSQSRSEPTPQPTVQPGRQPA